MAENENAVVEETSVQPETQPENQSAQPEGGEAPKKEGFGAKCKEWFRKQIVSLKRAPQRIPLVWQVIVSFLWLIWLFTFSRTLTKINAVEWAGLVVFINTLLSILILALFLNAFPKRKPANKVFIGLLFAFMAVIIVCDVIYYIQVNDYIAGHVNADMLNTNPFMQESLTLSIVHIVLIGISAVLLATLPLYSKLINKINTRKEIESTEMKEAIDTSEDD